MPVASWGAKHTNKMPAQAVNNQLIPRGSHRRSRVYARDKLKITFMSLPPGTRLGPYEIAEAIGSGGMGDVYRARDTRLDRDVAIKVLPERVARDAEARMRFEREAKAVAALTHPNILAIHDYGSEGGAAYSVTELLEGETLRRRINEGPLPWRKTIEIAAA